MGDYTTIKLEKDQTIVAAFAKNYPLLGSTFEWARPDKHEDLWIKQASLEYLRKGNELELAPHNKLPPHKPTIYHCPNGVILSHQLKSAQAELNLGFTVIFTAGQERVFQPKAVTNTTQPNLTLNAQDCVTKPTNYEKLYYDLRTAIRTATLRHTDYKLPDTAIIAEDLKASNNLSQATDSFERLLQEIIDQTREREQKSCKAKLDAQADRADRTEKKLREKIHQAMSALSGEGYYSGGLLSPRPEENRPHIITWYDEPRDNRIGRARAMGKSEILAGMVRKELGITG
jgi:hypothetical protein